MVSEGCEGRPAVRSGAAPLGAVLTEIEAAIIAGETPEGMEGRPVRLRYIEAAGQEAVYQITAESPAALLAKGEVLADEALAELKAFNEQLREGEVTLEDADVSLEDLEALERLLVDMNAGSGK